LPNILKELTKFAEEQAERRKVDKQVFIWAVICFCDFTRKHGYVLTYKGKENEEQNIQKHEQRPEQDNAIV
jgi:hypothetical protein